MEPTTAPAWRCVPGPFLTLADSQLNEFWNQTISAGSFPQAEFQSRLRHSPMETHERRGVQRALLQAQLYGHLVARHGRLCHPGGGEPLCGPQTSKEIVRSGWLRFRRGKYVITPEGLRVLATRFQNWPPKPLALK
jgi:hypothetical protein